MADSTPSKPSGGTSFAETALVLGGKSADEARRTGAIDKADDQVESLFSPQYQTVHSPAHRAVWERGIPIELFQSSEPDTPHDVTKVMDDSLAVVERHRTAGTLIGRGARNLFHLQHLDLVAETVAIDACQSGIDHITNAGYRQRSFGHVRRQDDTPGSARAENAVLLLR